jgi:hypothetical protein
MDLRDIAAARRAMANYRKGDRVRFTVAMTCPTCRKTGDAIWEEAALPNPEGLKPQLLSLPDGFYHRMRHDFAGLPEIVCAKCGQVQTD